MSRLTPQTGDWILPCGTGGVASIIKKLTFGQVNHAALVVDAVRTLETDGAWFKAKYMEVARFKDKNVFIVRPLFYNKESLEHIVFLADKYNGAPYSYVDIASNALLFWLKDQIRVKVVEFFSNKRFMICSELTARITYEATGEKKLRDYEGMTPEMLLELALGNPQLFEVEHTTL